MTSGPSTKKDKGAHLTEAEQLTIRSLKGNINRARTHITWGHLSNLYT